MAPDNSLENRDSDITASDLVNLASKIGPKLFDRRHTASKNRCLPKDTIDDLKDSKVLRACMPKRFGGFELPFGAHTDVAMELAKSCGSTAWVSGIIGSHNWWLGKYQPEAQFEVWENDPDAIVGAAFAHKQGTKGRKTKGGYLVSGRWMWCSGSAHCDWVSLMTPIIKENLPPELAMIIVPKEDYQIEDVWYSPGMRGSGSNDILIDEKFVPEHRITKLADLNKKDSPGCSLNTGPVYKLPMLDVFGYSVAIPTLGCAIATHNHYLSEMTGRVGLDSAKILEFQSQQLRAAESSMEIDAALEIYRSDLCKMWNAAENNRELKPHELNKFKRNCAYVATLARRSATRIIEAMGATGIADSNPAYTSFSDTIAGASHRALSWDINGTIWGKEMFGLNKNESEVDRRMAPKEKHN